MQYSDLIVEYDNVLPHDLCDRLIDTFEKSDKSEPGVTANGVTDSKLSTDLYISDFEEYSELDRLVFENFTEYVGEYTELYCSKINTIINNITDSGYQIQKTEANGKYDWHHDFYMNLTNEYDNPAKTLLRTNSRYATYIFYLNDYDASEENGGRTQFYNGGNIISIYPKKGKLLFFPANTLYTHRGEMLKSGVKYIMTGWLYINIPVPIPNWLNGPKR